MTERLAPVGAPADADTSPIDLGLNEAGNDPRDVEPSLVRSSAVVAVVRTPIVASGGVFGGSDSSLSLIAVLTVTAVGALLIVAGLRRRKT